MAMCSTGSLAIISQPQTTCSSIALAVTGSVLSPPYSLSTLSTTAGKTAPHAMTEFYSYAATPCSIGYSSICCSAASNPAYALSCIRDVLTNECAYVSICWSLTKVLACGLGGISATCLICNGTCVAGCAQPNKFAGNCNGCWDIVFKGGDCWYVCVGICVVCTTYDTAISQTCIRCVTNCVGNYCLSSGLKSNSVNSGIQQ